MLRGASELALPAVAKAGTGMRDRWSEMTITIKAKVYLIRAADHIPTIFAARQAAGKLAKGDQKPRLCATILGLRLHGCRLPDRSSRARS